MMTTTLTKMPSEHQDNKYQFTYRQIGDAVGVLTKNGIVVARVLWYEEPFRQYVVKTSFGAIWRNAPENLRDLTDETLISSANEIEIDTRCIRPFLKFIRGKDFGVRLTPEQRKEIENLFTSFYIENVNNKRLQREGEWRIKE